MLKVVPAFSEKNIPIMFAASDAYIPHLAITIKSILITRDDIHNYDIIVFHHLIKKERQEKIIDLADGPNISIRFFEMGEKLENYDFSVREGYGAESFYRAIVSDVLQMYEKVIYLDCDLVVLENIAKLFEIKNPEGKCIAAVRDINGISATYINYESRKEYMYKYLKLNHIRDYIQSGVMVFFIQNIRNKYSVEQIIKESCKREVMFGDQDVLNKLYVGDILLLDMKWNVIVNVDRVKFENQYLLAPNEIVMQYMMSRKEPYIIHYAGTKPWKIPDGDFAELYWNIARKSFFYGEIMKELIC